MAKQVTDILVKLGIENLAGLEKLKSSFRGLSQTINQSDQVLSKARKDIIAYGEGAQQSEALAKGMISALEGLKSQASFNSTVFKQLTKDISSYSTILRGSSDAQEMQRDSLLKMGAAAKNSASQLQTVINGLKGLRTEVRPGSSAFVQLGRDIDSLQARLRGINEESRQFRSVLGQALSVDATKAARQIESLKRVLADTNSSAENLQKALRQLELLNVGAGRERALLRFDVFGAQEGITYFERLKKSYQDLPKTTAVISQRISEVNTELENVTGYTRRRELTLELIRLNKELKRAVVDVTTAEEFAVMAARQRMQARRTAAGETGFGAFSREVTQRTAAGVYTGGGQKAAGASAALEGIRESFKTLDDAFNTIESASQRHQVALAEIEAKGQRLRSDQLDKAAQDRLSNTQAAFEQELALFDAQLRQRDSLLQRRGAVKGTLGLGGRELSSFYEGVVGIGTRRAAAEQSLMGRTPQQAFADIVNTFNSDLNRAGDGFLESERQLREAAIEFAGGSKKVRERFEQIALGKAPASMFPSTGESSSAYIQRLRKDFADVELPNFASLRKGTTRELQQVRESLQELRLDLNPLAASFESTEKRIVKSIRNIDKELEKRQLGRRRMTGMQVAQAAGAAVSGGIFGGPEGFLGGALGGIFGGVGGAFAGAAAGAQVGALRQQLGEFADYAAQIQKMKIALEGAAGSQEQFNQALSAANSVVRNLNVPQDVAIKGMTQLTAAVKGAGGEVSDAELVFKNVTAAIKATGGSAQDVDGAITAMVQVFSKGKVSAEELSGQLGERLPGAVTKFAKANDMALPELQKALEQGEVGLNELMKFIVYLGNENANVADKMAKSSQDAGARLTVAYNDMRIAVGEALQPIGAAFQEAFIPFIEGITPVLVDVLPKIGKLALALAKNFDTLAIAAAAALGVFAVGKIAAIGGVGAALLQLAAAAGTASVSLKALNAAALLNPWTALAAGVAAVGVAFYDANKEKERFDAVMKSGTADELAAEIERLQQKITEASSKTASYSSDIRGVGNEAGYASIEIRNMRNELEKIKGEYKVRLLFEQAGLDPEKGFYTPVGKQEPKVTDFQRPDSDKTGAGKTKKERESQLPQLMAQLAVAQQLAQINERIRDAEAAGNQMLQIRLEGEKELAQIAGRIQAISFEKIPANEARIKRQLLEIDAAEARANITAKLNQTATQAIKEATTASNDLGLTYTKQIEQRERLNELVSTGMTEALAQEYIQIEEIVEKERERLEIIKAQLEAVAAAGGPGAEGARSQISTIDQLIGGLSGTEGELKGLAEAAQPEEKGKLQQFIEQAEAELRDLEAVAVEISQNIGNAIGNSIASGLTGLIEGTTTARQIFADFLKDVGQILIQQGAKMIATYIAIGIARVFAGFASASSSGGATPGALGQATNTGLDTGAGNISDMLSGLAAKGAYFSSGQANFAQNSIKPFAMGGIVTRPTFFKYAKGGEMQNGLMGEAGPEAIMPLKRGTDGKLGVAAKLDGAMGRYRRSPGSAGGAAGGGGGTEGSAATATMQPIDVRYTVERINQVDYVTADQFQAGMRQAAAQGAKQGEQRALTSLRQNTNTRRRIGL